RLRQAPVERAREPGGWGQRKLVRGPPEARQRELRLYVVRSMLGDDRGGRRLVPTQSVSGHDAGREAVAGAGVQVAAEEAAGLTPPWNGHNKLTRSLLYRRHPTLSPALGGAFSCRALGTLGDGLTWEEAQICPYDSLIGHLQLSP